MNYRSLFILGRQPAIGHAELESLFGSTELTPMGNGVMAGTMQPHNVPFTRLGSVIKLGEILGIIDTTDWRKAQARLIPLGIQRVQDLSEGKIQLGLSAYDMRLSRGQLQAAGLELKKAMRRAGHSVRLVPNQEPALSSAQVLHNHLAGERGLELLLIQRGNQIVVGRTVAVQDINAYARRDQQRPQRDAFVGMLPPKLAQIIVNLGAGPLPAITSNNILDPFCGTGVILQEASLMGYGVYGTDLEPRMIDYSRQNLEWLTDRHFRPDERANGAKQQAEKLTPILEPGDATAHHWVHPFQAVAAETYLGRPLSSWPAPEKLQEIIGTCNLILEKFLQNLAHQTQSGLRLCLAVPAWIAPNGKIYHLSLLDRLDDLGYNRVSFSGVRNEDMVYHRPGQIVGRELLVIIRK